MRNNKLVLLIAVTLLAGCNFNISPEQPTPTVELLETPITATASPTPSPTEVQETQTPSPTLTAAVDLATSTPSDTPGPPTIPPTATATLGPYVHIIADQDTLGFIIQQYGYDFSPNAPIIREIVAINDNVFSADILPPVGSEILIPRQTATPIPENADITATADAALGVTRIDADTTIAQNTQIDCHVVESGETMVGIAQQYNTTLEVLSQLNQESGINWAGCNFTEYSGGPNCNPTIFEGQCINVPQPTPVPSATPTPSGSETPTPTPTFMPPSLVYPPNNAIVPAGDLVIQWVSVGILKPDDRYLIEITDSTTGSKYNQITRDTAIAVSDMSVPIPSDGQTHFMSWYVTVVRPNENGVYGVIGGVSDVRSFEWQSQ